MAVTAYVLSVAPKGMSAKKPNSVMLFICCKHLYLSSSFFQYLSLFFVANMRPHSAALVKVVIVVVLLLWWLVKATAAFFIQCKPSHSKCAETTSLKPQFPVQNLRVPSLRPAPSIIKAPGGFLLVKESPCQVTTNTTTRGLGSPNPLEIKIIHECIVCKFCCIHFRVHSVIC